jgi:hypothetical protein
MAAEVQAELFSVAYIWFVPVFDLVGRGSESCHELEGLMFGTFEVSQLHFAAELGERLYGLLLLQEIFGALLIWDLVQQQQLLLYAFELGVAYKPSSAWMGAHGD